MFEISSNLKVKTLLAEKLKENFFQWICLILDNRYKAINWAIEQRKTIIRIIKTRKKDSNKNN